jgi:hypothetical protein
MQFKGEKLPMVKEDSGQPKYVMTAKHLGDFSSLERRSELRRIKEEFEPTGIKTC